VISGIDQSVENPDLIQGDFLLRLERRSLDDIRALGVNSEEDDRRFETAARLSDINLGLYRKFMSPAIRAIASENGAAFMRRIHPNRMRFEMFSDRNPCMQGVASLAEAVQVDRHMARPDNPYSVMERLASDWIVASLDLWTEARDLWHESAFLLTYGSPLLQTLVGLGAEKPAGTRHVERELVRERSAVLLSAALADRLEEGGLLEAGVRALIYVLMADQRIDERGFVALQRIAAEPSSHKVGMTRFKEIVREQFLMLHQHQAKAMAALPKLLPEDRAERMAMLDLVRRIVTARGESSPEAGRRWAEVEAIFGASAPAGFPMLRSA
jgi:hypothetical protein